MIAFAAVLRQNDSLLYWYLLKNLTVQVPDSLHSFQNAVVVVLLLLSITRPLPGMEAGRKTMGPLKLSNYPGSGPEVLQRQRVAKE